MLQKKDAIKTSCDKNEKKNIEKKSNINDLVCTLLFN